MYGAAIDDASVKSRKQSSAADNGRAGRAPAVATWRLEVEVVEAQGLAFKADDHDARGEPTSHVFCSVAFAGGVRQTPVHPASLEPKFAAHFTFPMASAALEAPVKVLLWSTPKWPSAPSGTSGQRRAARDGDERGEVGEEGGEEEDGAWAHASTAAAASKQAADAATPVPYDPSMATEARFLGQVVLKSSQVETLLTSGGEKRIEMPLQKRTPRSKVRGTICLRFARREVDPDEASPPPPDESQYHQVDPETIPSDELFLWRAPSAWNTPTLHFWRVAHDLLLYEAAHLENMTAAAAAAAVSPTDASSAQEAGRTLSCSVQCCHTLRAIASLPGCNLSQVLPYMVEEYVQATTRDRETGGGTEWSQLVALLSYLWQTDYAEVAKAQKAQKAATGGGNGRTSNPSSSTDVGTGSRVAKPPYSKPVATELRRLLDYMESDLSQYKFSFAAHRHVVPALFSSTLVAFTTAQRILRAIDPKAESPSLRLERSLAACKARVFDLIYASATAEAHGVVPRQLLIMAEMVEEEVRYDLLYFAGPLRHFGRVNAIRLNVQTLITWLANRTEKELGEYKAIEVDVSTFDLLRKLRSLRDKFVRPVRAVLKSRGLHVSAFDGLHAWFLPHVDRWISGTGRHGEAFVDRAVKMDTLRPMTEEVLHSSSAYDVMSFLTQTYYELTALRWEDPPTAGAIFQLFAELAVGVAQQYGAWARGAALRPPQELGSTERCIIVNNLEQMASGMRDLARQVERHLQRTQCVWFGVTNGSPLMRATPRPCHFLPPRPCHFPRIPLFLAHHLTSLAPFLFSFSREDAVVAMAAAKAEERAEASGADGRLTQLTKRYAARFRRQRRSQSAKSSGDEDLFSLADLEMQLLVTDDEEGDNEAFDDDDEDDDTGSTVESGDEEEKGGRRRSSAASDRQRASSDADHPRRRTLISVVRPGDKSEQALLDKMTPRPSAAIDAIESTNQAFNLAQEEVSRSVYFQFTVQRRGHLSGVGRSPTRLSHGTAF